MNEQNERNEVYNDYGEVPPRSVYKKIKAKIKAKTESSEGAFELSRRGFLKASAITGAVAIAASSGLIVLSGREDSKAVAAASDVAEAVEPGDGVEVVSAALEAGEEVEVANAAEAIVKLLEAYDVDYLFWTTDDEVTFVADKLTPNVVEGKKPRTILSLHEYGAFAAAAEYAAASEKVGVCCFGALMGPMNAHGAIYNAYNFRRPVVAIGALNPGAGLPSTFQYWNDPGDLVREVTKWTSHFPYTSNLVGTFCQAFATAEAHPQAPVFISTFSDVWPKPMPGGIVKIPDVKRLGPAEAAVPNSEALEEAAALLVNANNPIILAGVGRSDEASNQLVNLAEFLQLPVVDAGRGFSNFPWRHPLHIGFSAAPYLNDADVVFAIDCDVPRGIPETAKVIQLDVDPVRAYQEVWGWFYKLRETDVRMIGESKATIPALIDTINWKLVGGLGPVKKTIEERGEKWKKVHDDQRAEWKAAAESHFGEKPISPWQLGYEVNKVMDDDTIWYAGHTSSGDQVLKTLIETNKPKSRINSGGGGHLGQSPYGAIGIACARPDKKVICLMGDGDYYWGHGDLALWTTVHENVAVLYVIENNHMWYRTKRGQIVNTVPDSKALEYDNHWANHLFPPMTDLSHAANGLGVYGECVKEPDELGPALRRAMDVVTKEKKSAIVDVWTKSLPLPL